MGWEAGKQGAIRDATEGLPHLLLRFLRFGLLAWGGPVAQIAMLRRELVDEERWLDGPRFNRLLAVYQVLPGPEATELAVHLGVLRGGRLGGLLAGLGFTLPGFLLMLVVSWLYVTADLSAPTIAALLLGAQVGVIALIVRAIWGIGRHVVVDLPLVGIAAAAAFASATGVAFWIILPLAGALYVVDRRWPWGAGIIALVVLITASVLAAVAAGWVMPEVAPEVTLAPGSGATPPSLVALFGSGLKAGLLTFGGAYTAIPFIREDAVGSGWLADSQFLDGIALSGVLPAPLIIFGTFVGFMGGGLAGAVAITVGIFLPAFAFGIMIGDRLEAVVERPALHRFLEGVAAGVVGLIVVTTMDLAVTLAGRLPAPVLALPILAGALLVLFRTGSRWAVPGVMAASALAGLLVFGSLGGP